jgi:hypothetical protein
MIESDYQTHRGRCINSNRHSSARSRWILVMRHGTLFGTFIAVNGPFLRVASPTRVPQFNAGLQLPML